MGVQGSPRLARLPPSPCGRPGGMLEPSGELQGAGRAARGDRTHRAELLGSVLHAPGSGSRRRLQLSKPRMRGCRPAAAQRQPAPRPSPWDPQANWPLPSSFHARIDPAQGSAPGERKGVQTQPSGPSSYSPASTSDLYFHVAPTPGPSSASAPTPSSQHPLSRPWILTLRVLPKPRICWSGILPTLFL